MTRRRCSSELARLGARLIIQRAVEEEFDTWLGRARYERRRARARLRTTSGLRNGFRPRHLQTAEGELRIEIPQAREAAMPFVSKLFPKWHCKRLLRTDPLKALVIGGFVRGLSMRDVESLCEEAGLGKTSKLDRREDLRGAARAVRGVLSPLALRRQSGRAVPRRDLPPGPTQRPEGGRDLRLGNRPRTAAGQLVSVRLGAREAKEDWLELGRDLISPRARGATPGRRRRRARADQRGRGDLAARRSSALRRSPPAQPARRSSRSQSRTGSGSTTGQRSPTRPRSRTASSASRSSSQSSSTAATSPPPAASPRTSTRSSCICATRSDTANGGGQRTSSNGRSVRSAGARK